MQRVYIIEDDILLRDLLCDLIKNEPELEVIGTQGDGVEGLRACVEKEPDILICDVKLPGLNGIEVVGRLKQDFPRLKIIVVSGTFSLAWIKRAMLLKVEGIISKGAGLDDLQRCLRSVAAGQSFYSADVLQRMPELLTTAENSGDLDVLTSREREILQLIAEGLTTKEIAAKLCISHRTADVHRCHIMQKLKVHNVAGLTRLAIRFGLVDAQAV